MEKTTVLVECSAPAAIPPCPVFVPFYGTDAFRDYPPFYAMVRWASDHVDARRVGFFRQHAYLDLLPGAKPATEPFLNESSCRRHGLDERFPTLCTAEVAVSPPTQLKRTTVRKFGEREQRCPREAVDEALRLVGERDPSYRDAASSYFSGTLLQSRPVFLLSRRMLGRFSAFLFPLLDALAASFPNLSADGLEFLADSLAAIFLSRCGEDAVRIPAVTFFQASDLTPLDPAFDRAVPVVFASNEQFAPSLGVCLRSLLEHLATDRNYDIVVLSSDLSADSRNRLSLMVRGRDHVSLRFFDPQALLAGRELEKNPTDHISLETYYRFLISSILPGYRKVLYLDCDTVINADVGLLYDIDLHGNALGAVVEAEVAGLRNADPLLASYLSQVVGLEDLDPYYQAGVLVLDLSAMGAIHTTDEWLRIAGLRKYRYNDQDIINMECKGRIEPLPMEWNVVTDCAGRRVPLIRQAPRSLLQSYLASRRDPLIVHYAGFEKPWDEPGSDFAYLFWDYASRSAFYDRLLCMVSKGRENDGPPIRERLFPRGSKRRRFAKRIYLRFSGVNRS